MIDKGVELSTRLVPCEYRGGWTHKIVLDDLESFLRYRGYELLSAKGRESGRGTPPALVVSYDASQRAALAFFPENVVVRLSLVPYAEPKGASAYNAKLVFEGLQEELTNHGVKPQMVAWRRSGRRSPMALTVQVSPPPGTVTRLYDA